MKQQDLELFKFNELFAEIVTVKKMLNDLNIHAINPRHPVQAKLECVLKMLDDYHNLRSDNKDTKFLYEKLYDYIIFIVVGCCFVLAMSVFYHLFMWIT